MLEEKSLFEGRMDDRYIGVFDSGLGGITVLQEFIKILPNEKFVFLADTKRSPYGEKTREELYNIVFSNIETLLNYEVKAIVFACNTASSLDMDLIRTKYKIPIITVLEATLEEIKAEDEKVLVAATEATISSEKHKKLINSVYTGIEVLGKACPDIVPSIEFADLSDDEAQNIVGSYLETYINFDLDALVLGCTHYPIWEGNFVKALPGVKVINPAHKTAKLTEKMLEKHNMLSLKDYSTTRDDLFLVTSDVEIFKYKIKKIFDLNPKNIKKIQII